MMEFLAQDAAIQAQFAGGARVLELGCGHGLPGILAQRLGATTDFQDYVRHSSSACLLA